MATPTSTLAPETRVDPNAPYKELASLLRKDGWFQKEPPIRIVLELVLHMVLLMAGLTVFILADNLAVELVALFVMTAGGLGITTSVHMSSHNASTKSSKVDKALVFFGYTFVHGMSATYWWNKHVVVHHPNPNIIGVDDDADLMPVFAINIRDKQNSKGFQRFFFTYLQGVLIPFALALNAFNTLRQSWSFLLPILADPKRRRRLHWIDLGVITSHWLVWFFLPMLFFDPLDVVGFYVLRMGLMGYAAFIAFAPAHFPDEAVFADKSQEDLKDYMLRQTATTVNFRVGPIGRVFCAGVEYQIEHHLFPGIPHTYFPALSPIVKKFCDEHNYPYRTLGWGEAILKSFKIFFHPKPVLDDLEEMHHAAVPVAATDGQKGQSAS